MIQLTLIRLEDSSTTVLSPDIKFEILSAFFSSPEHKVLMVSFCDHPMSVVHNFFKHLLLLNHSANLDETWQGCVLGEVPPKLFKRLNSTHNSGCHGNQKEIK